MQAAGEVSHAARGKGTIFYVTAKLFATFFAFSATFCDLHGVLRPKQSSRHLVEIVLQGVVRTRRSGGVAAESRFG